MLSKMPAKLSSRRTSNQNTSRMSKNGPKSCLVSEAHIRVFIPPSMFGLLKHFLAYVSIMTTKKLRSGANSLSIAIRRISKQPYAYLKSLMRMEGKKGQFRSF